METPWISYKENKPPVNKEILLLWICETDGCMGTVKCSVMSNGSLFISPGKFFVDGVNGEEAKYWMPIPDYPKDIQAFIAYHYDEHDQPEEGDQNSHLDNDFEIDEDLPF